MPGLGDDPLGFGPLGSGLEPISHAQPTAVVAVEILDGETLRYKLDDGGNFLGMDGVDQRVILICADVEEANPLDIITPAGISALAQAYRNALTSTLVKERAIDSLVVSVTDDGRQTVQRVIRYRDLGTSKAMTYRNGVITSP